MAFLQSPIDSSVTGCKLQQVPWYRIKQSGGQLIFVHGDQQYAQCFFIELPKEIGVRNTCDGHVTSGHWYYSLMSLGSVCSSMTAKNVCTDDRGRDLQTSMSSNVWRGHCLGCVSLNCRTPLYVLNGNLYGDRYLHEIIQPLVLPTLERIGAGSVFQGGNARPHCARVVTDFLRQNNVTRMDFLPCIFP